MREPTTRRHLLLALLPAGAALVCLVGGGVMPVDTVWGSAAEAVLLTAPAWLLAAALPWAVAVAAVTRKWALVLVGLLPLPLAGIPTLPGDGAGGVRVVSANVNSFPDRDDAEALRAALGALRADVLITIEQRGREVPGMVRVADNFDEPVVRISHHSAVYCRSELACRGEITPEIGSATMKMPVALVVVDGICVVGLHGPPPAPYDPSGLMPYMVEVASNVADGAMRADWGPCRVGDPALLIGDFNAVPGSAAYRVLTGAGFDDPERWRGIWGTSWPAGGGWPDFAVFRLDHVLARGLQVAVRERVALPGSDHKALVTRVAHPTRDG